MANFRSGTLGRSVKRFGRFRSMNKFARKSFGFKYGTIDSLAVPTDATAEPRVVLFQASQAEPGGQFGGNVRNVSFDVALGFSWSIDATPETNFTFISTAIRWAFLCVDSDDQTDNFEDYISDTRALAWGQHVLNIVSITNAINGAERQFNTRVRFKQRFMKFDDEVLICPMLVQAADSAVSDLRMWVMSRVSWEMP